MTKNENIKKVAIILGFYNGNKYLLEQINSIVTQTHKNLKIFIFNDKSTEKICETNIFSHKKLNSVVSIINREKNIGFAKNFLFGLKDVGSDFDYYAFSDQDDIWENYKIENSLKKINSFNSTKPVLYFSRTAYFSDDGKKKIGSSKNFNKKKCFKNALVQNIAGGNTIVMNKEARNLVVKSLISNKYIAHDWWCYQLITAAGGEIIFDSKKSVRYRQHTSNLIGSNIGLYERFIRLKKFYSGNFKEWTDINVNNLILNRSLITNENLRTLKTFIKSRNSNNILKRLNLYLKSGVFRQNSSENIIFLIGIALKKI